MKLEGANFGLASRDKWSSDRKRRNRTFFFDRGKKSHRGEVSCFICFRRLYLTVGVDSSLKLYGNDKVLLRNTYFDLFLGSPEPVISCYVSTPVVVKGST